MVSRWSRACDVIMLMSLLYPGQYIYTEVSDIHLVWHTVPCLLHRCGSAAGVHYLIDMPRSDCKNMSCDST